MDTPSEWSIELEIKNYRCFSREEPCRLTIKPGFIAVVGPNNTGKSTLLRFFYEFRDIFQNLADNPRTVVEGFRNPQGLPAPRSVPDHGEVFTDSNDGPLSFRIAVKVPRPERRYPDADEVEWLQFEIDRPYSNFRSSSSVADFEVASYQPDDALLKDGRGIHGDLTEYQWALRLLADSVYIGAFRNAIGEAQDDYYDLRIGRRFVAEWNQYKLGGQKASADAATKLTQEIQRIFGFDYLEINPHADGTTLRVTVNDHSYRLPELGSGIAQFIIVLTFLAVRRPSLVLIDEPELNLHPSLQLDFLTTVGSYAREAVVFGTHSIGLARSADVVYSVTARRQGVSIVRPLEATPSLPMFLGEMSYSGYVALGADRILLVEGSTDIRTVQQWLRALKLDHTTVLLSLGGGSMISAGRDLELQELRRISENVYALIDSERPAQDADLDAGRQAFVESCEAVGIRCHVLDRRATENYFTERAIHQVKGSRYRALSPYELLDDADLRWAKSENWRIARAMEFAELEGTDLGTFLRTLSATG